MTMILKCSNREVLHKRADNGATEAYFADGSAMTSAEWNEYAERVRTDCKAEASARTSQRIAENRAAFEADRPARIKEYNLERSPEFQKLTADRAWTVMDVRRLLPEVSCIVPEAKGMTARTGLVSGRGCDFATVRIVNNPAPDYIAEFAWSTIAAALNNNRALRF